MENKELIFDSNIDKLIESADLTKEAPPVLVYEESKTACKRKIERTEPGFNFLCQYVRLPDEPCTRDVINPHK